MIANLWFDRTTGMTTYNIEDPDFRLLTEGANIDADTEIDPTQKAATSDGRSPRTTLTTTFSDELAAYTGGRAKVFGVSVCPWDDRRFVRHLGATTPGPAIPAVPGIRCAVKPSLRVVSDERA
jgi:hypothetical protein